ncbi:hypothetical protein FSP39_000261 [Pinctada imbricata]|uniref:Aminopeptidase n=1 Tax=Pinctada imbricata TaxID=66713 RepID=A0AA88XNW9_PINIB|nr:hypothetical protein FSP39_000261 [Pinctada imbricata]
MSSKTKTYVNKRVVYACVILMLALPVLVGVLVWYFTKNDCDAKLNNNPPSAAAAANTGGKLSTKLPEVTTRKPSADEPWLYPRLTRDVLPSHYDITLYPNFYGDNGVFEGNETVELDVKKDTRFVLIHINFLDISQTSLRFKDTSQSISFKTPWFYEKNQYWVIECDQTLAKGSVLVLDLTFSGSLTRAIVGFYKSSYINSITKEERHLATSKFEPVNARRAFPCFDEPNIKANYTVHLVHRPGYIALSNMPDTDTVPWEHENSLLITHFERSVEMSTYLVCFTVCDFTYLNDTTKFGTPIRAFATPDRVNQTVFALMVAKNAMELYEEYFNVKYPLPKQDLIAIPDFVSGAMEHWGLISFRETNFLYDEEEASPANQQRVNIVVSHEVSHQWFGNLVTMDWWDDLWLNEGFASFIEYLGANYSEPSWKMLEQFVTEDVQPIMVTDAGVSSHPIILQVDNPDQINEVFDGITYSKIMENVDKAGLIDDAFNLARGGYIHYEVPLKLTLYLDQENAHLPWESTYTALDYISDMMETGKSFGQWRVGIIIHDCRMPFLEYILAKSKPVLERLGWEDSSDHLQNLMRTNMISLACGMADKDCLDNATRKFRNWLDNGISVSPNIRSLVYRYGMQSGGSAKDWDKLWNKYQTETVPQEQIKLLYGMAHTRIVWLLVRFLEYTKNESLVRSQDFFTVVQYIAQNPAGKSLTWDWVRSNYDYLVQRFTTFSRSFGRLVPNIISDFNTAFQLQEVEEFFKTYPDAGAGANARGMALEGIKRNIKWKQDSETQIVDWLCNTVKIC